MHTKNKVREMFEQGNGILRLLPNFVAYKFSKPGFRLKLHPDDYYSFGMNNGAIKERLLSSVMQSRSSYVDTGDNPVSLLEVVQELGAEIIGNELMEKHGTWPIHAKFFDYGEPLFHHLHLDFDAAARVGQLGKPEAYYYPPQMNNYPGTFPHTYFGFDPSTTKEMVRERLLDFENRDMRITELSRAFRLQLGTGWFIPGGVLHAPGSYCTYEPQWNSSSGAIYENVTAGEVNSMDGIRRSCPEDKQNDMDYIMSLIDWEKNVDPHFKEKYFRPPVICVDEATHTEKWITYNNPYFSAKELTVYPGQTVTIKDEAAYGCVFVQGHGRFGCFDAETPTMIRFGQRTADEYFVSEQAARKGVTICNPSQFEPIVILKHFADNCTML
ncbi:MAG: hypothetical protein FWC32_03405 [Firmicutes bacterium]|nr:hypothetical protein [Bacillota bacterium]